MPGHLKQTQQLMGTTAALTLIITTKVNVGLEVTVKVSGIDLQEKAKMLP